MGIVSASRIHVGEYYVTAEDIAQFLPEFNPDTTRDEFINFYRSKTLENALAE